MCETKNGTKQKPKRKKTDLSEVPTPIVTTLSVVCGVGSGTRADLGVTTLTADDLTSVPSHAFNGKHTRLKQATRMEVKTAGLLS
jgi:hypothetical protein